MFDFPVFGANGLEDSVGERSPSGTRIVPQNENDLQLPRMHGDAEAALAEAQGKINLLMAGISPAQVRAMDTLSAKERQLAAWQARVCELNAVFASAKNRMLCTPPEFPGVRKERSEALKALEAELSVSREELLAAEEELAAAIQHLQSFRAVTA
jgi:hypothetical protein